VRSAPAALRLKDDVPRDHRPPSPRTISGFVYIVLLVMAILIAYVAVRALIG